jgi:hypothetical protein
MNDLYDAYKEEAFRLLMNGDMLLNAVSKHIGALRSPFCPAVRIDAINQNHHRTCDNFVCTIAGACRVLEDRRSQLSHYEEQARVRRQRRWIVRKLKDYGLTLQSAKTLVSAQNGTVYFSYHLIVKMESHLVDS